MSFVKIHKILSKNGAMPTVAGGHPLSLVAIVGLASRFIIVPMVVVTQEK